MNFVKSLSDFRLFHIFEKSMNGNTSCLSRKMLSFLISDSLVIIVETHLFCCHKPETSDFDAVLFGQPNKICSVLFFWICIVNYDAFTFQNLLFSYLVAFFFCFQGISIDSWVFRKIITPESWFSWSWTSNKDYHFFLNIIYNFWDVFLTYNNLSILWDRFRIKTLDSDFLFIAKVKVFWRKELNSNI